MESYNDILARMKQKYKEYAGFTVENNTDIDIRMRVLAGEIFSMQVSLDKLKQQVFVNTATGSALDSHAAERNLVRKDASKAHGVLTFSLAKANTDYDVEIPHGTVCSTSGQKPVRFITTEDAVISSGTLSVSVSAQALEAGICGNAAAKVITVVVTPGISNVSVTNAEEFTGGDDTETDDSLRKRIIDTYKNISTGANTAYYRAIALRHSGVYSVNVVARPNGQRGKINIYVAGKGALLDSDTVAQIQKEIDVMREINVDATVLSPTVHHVNSSVAITVKEGYVFSEVSEQVKQTVIDEFSDTDIGKSIYLAEIGKVILSVDGVENYSFVKGASTDMKAGESDMLILNNLYVTEISNS